MATPALKSPCRFFVSEEGCRYGNKCRFSHDLGSMFGRRTTQSPGQQWNATSPSMGHSTPKIRLERAPRDVCDYYWGTGQCNRGFDCTFRHQKNPNPQFVTHDVTTGATATSIGIVDLDENEGSANAALEFFTMDNLTEMAGVGLHRTQEGTPEHAHNKIKPYLVRGSSLSRPADMRPLISILASVNRRNHAWSVDKAQVMNPSLTLKDTLLIYDRQ